MVLWIARNQDGSLWLHEEKPSLVYDEERRKWYYEKGGFLDFYDETLSEKDNVKLVSQKIREVIVELKNELEREKNQ